MDIEDFKKISYIGSFIDYINQKNYSTLTLKSYLNDLRYFYNYLEKDLTKVTEEDIKSYIEFLYKKKMNSTSVSRTISTFKTFYKYLYKNNIIEKKDYPLNKVVYPKKEKKLPKFLYYNELLEIIEESKKDKDGVRDLLIIEMLYATGVRISELTNIKISDIDFNHRRIVVLGKGNKERVVYYGEYAEDAMNEYISSHINNTEYLFANQHGKKLTSSGVRYIIDNIMKRLSVKTHVTPHVLRHSFATDMLNNGCDIKVVQELLGHSSLRSTEIYTHVTNEKLKQVYYDCFPRQGK